MFAQRAKTRYHGRNPVLGESGPGAIRRLRLKIARLCLRFQDAFLPFALRDLKKLWRRHYRAFALIWLDHGGASYGAGEELSERDR